MGKCVSEEKASLEDTVRFMRYLRIKKYKKFIAGIGQEVELEPENKGI